MILGLHSICYNTNATLERAFAPWREVKNGALKGLVNDVYFAVQAAAFPETVSLGYDLHSNDGTEETLLKFKQEGLFNDLVIHNQAVEEQVLWSENVRFLQKYNPDYIFMIGGDEVFTVEEIEKVLKFVLHNPLTDYFRINFKNFFGRGKYVKDFIAPRIWSNKRNGGVDYHYKDDLVMFKNGKRDTECSCMTVPSKVVFPAHYSWSLPPECSDEKNKKFVMRKLGFQKIRYVHPSYRWNEEKNELELDPTYYARVGKGVPEIYYE
jgi:hypothetical protein